MAENISVFFSLLHNAFFFFFFWPHRTGGVILVPRPGIKLGPSAVKVWSPNHWTAREFPTMPLFKNIFIQFLKVTFHLQLSQNIGYIPHVVQYILVAYLTPNSSYLPLPSPYCPPLLVTTSLFSISVSLHLFFCNFIYFWLHWVFVAVRVLSLVVASGGYSSLRCVGFSLRWLLLVAEHGLQAHGLQ